MWATKSSASREWAAKTFSNPPPTTTLRVDRSVYIPHQRRCPKFYGYQDSPDSVDLEDWIEEVEACLEGGPLSDKERAIFLFDHLGGKPWSETKHPSSSERENPDKVISILKGLYIGKKPLVVLQQHFYDRKQQEGQSLRQFSHALMS